MGRRRKGLPVNGWVALDKPEGLGSTQAVGRVRRAFEAQKAGHAGTLDPLATGVLPIALGEATKTVSFLMDADKAYRFTIAWGENTASFDRDGAIAATSDARPSPDAVTKALGAFVGEIEQIPPAFSAIKVDGERAYDLARAGLEFELAPRAITIHSAQVLDAPDADHIELEIVCGKGAYVRGLARDLAAALGACGHVSALRRTRVGPFTAENAVTLEQLEDLCHRDAGLEALSPVETALDDIPALAVTTEDAFRLSQGRPIVLLPRQVETLRTRLSAPDGVGFASRIVLAVHGGGPVSICEIRAGQLRPVRVFNL
ncbi:MAG TPA: tRNA pseudouridine(55) synthase TruB [Caulobacteraceae bacterium]|nr:tRNA pseudouridine(55) synthase TruB [Caulobacteraceae bacterium]